MTAYSDQFPKVETPPFEQRFRWIENTRSGMGECVVCGQRGGKPSWDSDSHWCRAHREHVRCTCGKAVSAKGIAMHRAANERHGHPCPPIGQQQPAWTEPRRPPTSALRDRVARLEEALKEVVQHLGDSKRPRPAKALKIAREALS